MEEMRSLADLLDLQAVDLEIDRLLNQRQSLPTLEEYQAAHEEVERLTGEHTEAAAALRQTSLDLDKSNGELELAEQKLHAEQNRLYAGGIGARETENLRNEVDMLERRQSKLEEDVLELMERRDQEERRVGELAERLRGATAGKDRLEASITEEWKGIDAQIGRKEARKEEIVALIPQDLIELYEELRVAKEGVAAGRLAEGICGGCHLRLSLAEQNEVLKGDPPRCLHCRRILVP